MASPAEDGRSQDPRPPRLKTATVTTSSSRLPPRPSGGSCSELISEGYVIRVDTETARTSRAPSRVARGRVRRRARSRPDLWRRRAHAARACVGQPTSPTRVSTTCGCSPSPADAEASGHARRRSRSTSTSPRSLSAGIGAAITGFDERTSLRPTWITNEVMRPSPGGDPTASPVLVAPRAAAPRRRRAHRACATRLPFLSLPRS